MNIETKWKHPTGKTPKKVAIIGLGATAQDWHTDHAQYTPQTEQVDEVWTVNKGFRTLQCDMVFIMDDLVDEARKSERYGKDIELVSEKIPVITSTVDAAVLERWPAVHAYPLGEVLRFWGYHIHTKRSPRGTMKTEDDDLDIGLMETAYFNNSIPYLLAYAGMIGVKNIYMFGCDYTFPGMASREDDRANAEYWIGACQFGLGISFRFPQRTTLLNRNRGRVFYGWNGRQPF